MGIQNLLPQLKDVIKPAHISHLNGQRVAVDGYCWLHRSIYFAQFDYKTGTIIDDGKWIEYCINMIDMFLKYDIKVFMVFDGNYLPGKEGTESERAKARENNRAKGMDLAQSGDLQNARMFLSRAVDIDPLMASKLIRVLQICRPQVNCVVAPYEADAQLAALCYDDIVDAVVSEDSDTIPYGCKQILFKLDRTGACERLRLDDLFKIPIEGFDMQGFTKDMTISMAVLSGCDYLVSFILYV